MYVASVFLNVGIQCRSAHACCDDQRPCKRCIEIGTPNDCIDAETKKRGRKRKMSTEQTPMLGAPNPNFSIGPRNRQFIPNQPNSFRLIDNTTQDMKRLRTNNQQFIPLQQYSVNQVAPQAQPQLMLSMDYNTVPNNYQNNYYPNNYAYQQQLSMYQYQEIQRRQQEEMELKQLQEENAMLKQQLVSLATNASNFTKTLLGLDLASRIGSLLTVEGGRIVSWNSSLRTALGYNQEDLLTLVKSIRDLIADHDMKRVLDILVSSVMNRRESCSIEFHLKHKSGASIPAQFTTMFAYDARDKKPMYSISFVSFDGKIEEYAFAQQLQLMQLQSSRQRNATSTPDIS